MEREGTVRVFERRLSVGDLVLVPCRVVRTEGGGGSVVALQTEEPPEGEAWPVAAVEAGRPILLGPAEGEVPQ